MRTAGMVALALAFALGGCDDGPGEQGQARAVVTDDPSGGPSTSPSQYSLEPAATTTFSGDFSTNAQVLISADGQSWISLGSPSSVTAQLQSTGDSTTVHASSSVRAGTYAYVRLVLSGASAQIHAGSTIGGAALTADVQMRVGGSDQQVVIEKQVEPFTIQAGSETTLVFDLNSEAWVNEQNTQDEQVEDEEVQQSSRAGRHTREEQ